MKKISKIALILLAVMLIILCTPFSKPAHAAQTNKLIALTFDDGPHKTYTTQLLDGLKQRGAKVTFFMVGTNASSYNNLVQRAYDEGHEIGNHSYSHPNMNTLNASGVQNELNKTASILDKACGSGTDYLVRPPYGNANATVLSAIHSPAVIWYVDTNDWKYRDANHVYNHIVNNASDGAIILCHDIYATTVQGALRAVDTLKARGYEFVTVSELYRRRGVTIQDGVKLYNCKNTGVDYGKVQKPVITYEPAAGGVRVTMHSPGGAPVYYTLNGSRFTNQSTRYTGSFVVKTPVNIQAIAAFDLNGDRSEKTSLNITLLSCNKPNITITNGMVHLECAMADAPIYYTVDGSKADIHSVRYWGDIRVNPGTTIRAIAGGGSYMVSSETRKHYSKNGNVFADVFPEDWYYSAVDDLVSLELMYGMGNDIFAPNMTCSRAQAVTFLWRAAGSPSPKTESMPFTDVPAYAYYKDAVLWAVQEGITAGYTPTTFCPDMDCTRAQIVSFLWRSQKSPEVTAENPFVDVEEDAYYYKAVLWAVKEGITAGYTPTTFCPEMNCTRGQIVTFIYRHMTEA